MESNQRTKRNIKPFNGDHYSIWKFRIRALIAEEGARTVLEEHPPQEKAENWESLEMIAKGCIIEHLSDTMIGIVTEEETARDILKKFDAIYERKSLATQLAVMKKLLSFKLKGDTLLMEHFLKFDEMLIELIAAGGVVNEMGKVAHLLLTLPSSYDGVVTAIQTLADENLTLAFVKTRLLDHETKLKQDSSDTSAKVLQAKYSQNKTTSFNYRRNKNNFRKYQERNKNQQSNKYYNNKRSSNSRRFKSQKCDHCGRYNHVKNDCYFYKRSQRTLQAIQTTQCSEESFAFMVGLNACQDTSAKDDIFFILDSGATDHVVNNQHYFTKFSELDNPIKISVAKNNTSLTAVLRGNIDIITNLGFSGVLENVLYAPDLPYNLLSVRRMQEAGMTVIFKETGAVTITRGGKTVIEGKSLNNLINIHFKLKLNKHKRHKYLVNSTKVSTTESYKLWHQRLGHIGQNKFLEIKTKELAQNCNPLQNINPTSDLCEACIYGKQARLPFSKQKNKSHVQRPLFNIHSDVCGPITPPTIDNKNYFITFIDEFTHYTVTYLLTYKSDTFKVFQDFVAKSESHFNLKIVHLYCDNGREYLSNEMKSYCVEHGITYHLTVPYTPQQNSVAERMNRTLTEKARAMIHGAYLNKCFWGEAVLTATYLLNLTPTKAIMQKKTPFELWHNKKPRLNHLKVFGSTAYVHNKTKKTKFEENSIKGILVGYEPSGYKIFSTNTNKFITARDVIFDEINFKTSRPLIELDERAENEGVKVSKTDNKSVTIFPDNQGEIKAGQNKTVSETDNINQSTSTSESETPELRRSERLKNRTKISYQENDIELLTCIQQSLLQIPSCYQEIYKRKDRYKWEEAINDEINSLLQNNTWSLVPKPVNKNIVDCKWVFTIKNDMFGNLSKYKARLVARGFSQHYLVDYNETFAPVARICTLRILLAFANQFNLLAHHMDVKTAYLNGILQEEIYMKVPEGIKVEKENIVCKLHKSLYGLKQSARCWFKRFDDVLKQHNFINSSVDRCLYFLDKGRIKENIYLILYVDDLLIITGNMSTMSNFKNYLMQQFSMSDLQEIKFFLGIKIQRNKDEMSLDQSKYLKTVLQKFNMSDCKAVKTPLPDKINYTALNSNENYDAPCRNLIGCLMYSTLCTRPDLCTAVNLLSRYQVKHNKELWQCLKRILRYIKGTVGLKLIYKRNNYNNVLTGYVDADWGNNEIDRKSTTGYLFKLFESCLICWNTKRQSSVAASSTEAEYMAIFEGVREALWLKSLLKDIKVEIAKPIILFEDNNGCIAIATNPGDHKRSKHIDIKYHFTREQVERKIIILKYIPTGQQLADIFTKQVPAPKFQELRFQLGMVDSNLQ